MQLQDHELSHLLSTFTPGCYLHAEDFVSALIGPFDSAVEVQHHLDFCEQRGDSGVVHGLVAKGSLKWLELYPLTFLITPEEDRSFT